MQFLKNSIRAIVFFFLCQLVLTSAFAEVTPADERPFLEILQGDHVVPDLSQGLCPKDRSMQYLHHLVLIDSTQDINAKQLAVIAELFLGKDMLKRMMPYDRLSIVRLRNIAPAANKAIFSKCRPRNGEADSPYKLDHHNWLYESQGQLQTIFKFFTDGVDEAIQDINPPRLPDGYPLKITGSPIMEQLKEISRKPIYKFDEYANYQQRKLTVVSDLLQNTERLPFYSWCMNSPRSKCPSYEDFKNLLGFELPDFGQNIEVEIFYLNLKHDPNLDLDVLEFWQGYFKDAGIDDVNYEIETDHQ